MAVIYDATLQPGKMDLIRTHLDAQPWGGDGPITRIGAYRFDDPAGEVGIEGHLVARGGRILHVPLTYRAAPLDGADPYLVGAMEHSVLGKRWVYAAAGDPAAVDAYTRFLRGEQPQAALEVHHVDGSVDSAEPDVTLHVEGADDRTAPTLRLTTEVAEPVDGAVRMCARWSGGDGVLAALR